MSNQSELLVCASSLPTLSDSLGQKSIHILALRHRSQAITDSDYNIVFNILRKTIPQMPGITPPICTENLPIPLNESCRCGLDKSMGIRFSSDDGSLRNSKNPQIYRKFKNVSISSSSVFTELQSFSIKEVSKHNSTSSGWVVFDRGVYDVTTFIPNHPGRDMYGFVF